jgi:hypothetical protein
MIFVNTLDMQVQFAFRKVSYDLVNRIHACSMAIRGDLVSVLRFIRGCLSVRVIPICTLSLQGIAK